MLTLTNEEQKERKKTVEPAVLEGTEVFSNFEYSQIMWSMKGPSVENRAKL